MGHSTSMYYYIDIYPIWCNFVGKMHKGLATSLPYTYYSDINYTCIEYIDDTYYVPTTTSLRQKEPTLTADSLLWKNKGINLESYKHNVFSF